MIADAFGGTSADTGSFLNKYPWSVKLNVDGTPLTIEVHGTGKSLRVLVDDFRNRFDLACSIGTPAYQSFECPVRDALPGGPIVHIPSALGEDNEALTRRFCDVPGNREDILALALRDGEELAVYAVQMVATLNVLDPPLPRQRVDALVRLVRRNVTETPLALLINAPFQLIADIEHREPIAWPPKLHVFGTPDGVVLPDCGNCKTPVHLVVTIHLADPMFGNAAGKGHLPVVSCLNCDAYSAPMWLSFGANQLRLLDQADGRCFNEFPPRLQVRAMKCMPVDNMDADSRPRHQIGGQPNWIQSPFVPKCLRCHSPMAFFAQIDTDDYLGVQFGDDGSLFSFVCTRCEVICTFVQSK